MNHIDLFTAVRASDWKTADSELSQDLPPLTGICAPDRNYPEMEQVLHSHAAMISALSVPINSSPEFQRTLRRTIHAAKQYRIPSVAEKIDGSTHTAPHQCVFFLDECAEQGVQRVELDASFLRFFSKPRQIVVMAAQRGLDVHFELPLNDGTFSGSIPKFAYEEGERWLDAGALHLIVREDEEEGFFSLFDRRGHLKPDVADPLGVFFGLHSLLFSSHHFGRQRALLEHFGAEVQLCDVPWSSVSRLELYRRTRQFPVEDSEKWRADLVERRFRAGRHPR